MSEEQRPDHHRVDSITDLYGRSRGHSDHLKRIDERFEKLEEDLVSRKEFDPVKQLVYGLVATIMLAFIGAVVSMVLKGK